MAETAEEPIIGTSSAEAVAKRQERVKQRQAQAKPGSGKESEIVAIPDPQMRNLPRSVVIHGIDLVLVDLPSGEETAEFQDKLNAWPDELLACALAMNESQRSGIDYAVVARVQTGWARNKDAKAPETTPTALADAMVKIPFGIAVYHDLIAETVYLMAHKTPDLTVEALQEKIAAHWTKPAHFVDAIRILLRINVGLDPEYAVRFPGDMAERFPVESAG